MLSLGPLLHAPHSLCYVFGSKKKRVNWRQFNITDAALFCTCAGTHQKDSRGGCLPCLFLLPPTSPNFPPFTLTPSNTVSDSFCLRILWWYSNDFELFSKLERWFRNVGTIYIGHLSFTAVICFHEKFCFMEKPTLQGKMTHLEMK